LVLPILLLVLLAVVQLSTYLMASQAIQAAALVGAREATLPGADDTTVRGAVRRALQGWRFKDCLGDEDIVIQPDDWQTTSGCVGVTVKVDADRAAINALWKLAGISLAGKEICAQYVMRKQ
jgi:Flp pilus assembly protein TadG